MREENNSNFIFDIIERGKHKSIKEKSDILGSEEILKIAKFLIENKGYPSRLAMTLANRIIKKRGIHENKKSKF